MTKLPRIFLPLLLGSLSPLPGCVFGSQFDDGAQSSADDAGETSSGEDAASDGDSPGAEDVSGTSADESDDDTSSGDDAGDDAAACIPLSISESTLVPGEYGIGDTLDVAFVRATTQDNLAGPASDLLQIEFFSIFDDGPTLGVFDLSTPEGENLAHCHKCVFLITDYETYTPGPMFFASAGTLTIDEMVSGTMSRGSVHNLTLVQVDTDPPEGGVTQTPDGACYTIDSIEWDFTRAGGDGD